jgi:hypothetical protein
LNEEKSCHSPRQLKGMRYQQLVSGCRLHTV